MTAEGIINVLGLAAIGLPALLLAVLGLVPLLTRRSLGEAAIARWTASCVVAGLAAVLGIIATMVFAGTTDVALEIGDWVAIPAEHFHFHLKFVFDRLSLPLVVLTFVLVGAVGAFANRYLHREPGYARFYVSFAVFLLGMVWATLAGTIETLFIGWELVGLASALLVAYFHERSAPVLNAQRIWSIYRISDAAFLLAALVLHHVSGGGDFSAMMGRGSWPAGVADLTSTQALGVGLLLLAAAAGKSGLVPFSGWLPRAMEGPTPSSAVFYGALSVHLGAFLLLRVGPILELSAWLSAAVVTMGLASALFATLAGRVQTDAKSVLAYASLAQVGLITAEIGLGWRWIPLIHIIGHACLRTLQLLRAPSLLQDYQALENAVGVPLHNGVPPRRVGWASLEAYRIGFERGQLDATLDRFVVAPFLRAFRWCDTAERRWMAWLSGPSTPAPEAPTALPHSVEEP